MVFKKKNENNHLAITVSPVSITFTTTTTSLVVSAQDLVGPDLVILNISAFKKTITKFLASSTLDKPSTAIALEGYSVQELIADDHFVPKREFQNLVWQGIPLSHQTNTSLYFCAIGQELIFQYQLLASSCNLKLVSLTTCTMAQLTSYGMAISCSSIHELKQQLKVISPQAAVLKLASGKV